MDAESAASAHPGDRARAAAERLGDGGEGNHLDSIVRALDDVDPNVRDAAASALTHAERRLDRVFR